MSYFHKGNCSDTPFQTKRFAIKKTNYWMWHLAPNIERFCWKATVSKSLCFNGYVCLCPYLYDIHRKKSLAKALGRRFFLQHQIPNNNKNWRFKQVLFVGMALQIFHGIIFIFKDLQVWGSNYPENYIRY